jgi:hypothetical protein
MSLDAAFVAKYKPLGQGRFEDTWVHEMTVDELIALIGWLSEERNATIKQHHRDLAVICGKPVDDAPGSHDLV